MKTLMQITFYLSYRKLDSVRLMNCITLKSSVFRIMCFVAKEV